MIEASTPRSLLELFLTDAVAHLGTLRTGFDALAANPDQERSLLPELQRAAHSIRGAAKIIGFEAAAELARALETLLDGVDAGGPERLATRVGTVWQALDYLARMANVRAAALPEWERAESDGLRRLAVELERLQKAPAPAEPMRPALRPKARARNAEPSSREGQGSSVLELFRTETAACTELLGAGLVELESAGKADLEGLMRAAHSIKGAARVVGIDVAVRVAHALEDCLVTAQHGALALPHETIDLLLSAVDLLAEIGQLSPEDVAAWEHDRGTALTQTVDRLRQLAHVRRSVPPAEATVTDTAPASGAGEPAPSRHRSISVAPPTPLEPVMSALPPARRNSSTIPARPSRVSALGRTQDRVVRVNAQSINRLMGLAGESLVESRRVQGFGSSMQRLRRRQGEVSALLESLQRQGAELAPLLRSLLDDAVARTTECRSLLSEHMTELDSYAQRVDDLSDRLYREALKSRMRPFGDCAHGFPRMVRDVARQLGKEVRFELAGDKTDVDRDVLESLEAPLTHLLRNAVDHGLETPDARVNNGKEAQGTVRLEARHHAGMLAITVSDDGRGIDPARLRTKIVERGLLAANVTDGLSPLELYEFIFLPGFSTAANVTEISGRGVGLDAVRSMVEAASGVVRVNSELGRGTSFHLQLPVTRSVMRAVVTEIAGEAYAFPLLRVERILRLPWANVQTLGAVQYFVLEGENVSLVGASQILGFGAERTHSKESCVVVVGDRTRRYGVVVERFLGEHDLVVRPLDPRLGKVQDIAAAAILVDGAPALILDVDDLIRSIEKLAQTGRIDKLSASVNPRLGARQKRVLVVDDSITVREVERQLLVNRGYAVDVAVDGIDGLNSVRSTSYDLVVSDIDMPRMGGLELVRSIKQDPKLSAIPVIIVSYKDREEDRMRGLDAGANYYLTKSSFHDETLVRAVEELIGSADT